jgi:hypothetical protein
VGGPDPTFWYFALLRMKTGSRQGGIAINASVRERECKHRKRMQPVLGTSAFAERTGSDGSTRSDKGEER